MNLQLEQTRYEITTWLRALEYQQQENVYMKTHIAEVVKNNVTKYALCQLEHYQNLFLDKDAVIALLRCDILHLLNQLKVDDVQIRVNSLRIDIQKMEQDFNLLRIGFNEYMQMMVSS